MIAAIVVAASVYFTMPKYSVGRFGPCTIDSMAPPALTKRLSIYGRVVPDPRWVQLWGLRLSRAGMKDGLRLSFSLAPSMFFSGESVGVWCQVADSAGNWQTSTCNQLKYWRIP